MRPGAHQRPARMLSVACLASWLAAPSASAQGPREIDEVAYAEGLRGYWLAQVIANWTGLRTEGARTVPPFYTDADWPITFDGRMLDFVLTQDPWAADDDTDIEYVYLHLLDQHETSLLSPAQIANGWVNHINRFIWVSNATARERLGRGALPPSTGMGCANQHRLMIDAQLTTEVFGLLNPGRPDAALQMADLPIRTTASGHAAHAAQFHVILYSLAPLADPSLPGRERVTRLVQDARTYLPDTSKAADICDTVLADFLANPDPQDWERTRDLVYQRYQADAPAHGFLYRGWYESSVNFAAALLALLYGEGDLRRTIQIGTLSGWDSDNGTATMGGLIGFLVGESGVRAAFPGASLSDRYWISRTRDNLPDRVEPQGDSIEDTFPLIADRMLGITRRAITDQGGLVDAHAGRWLLPPPLPTLDANPLVREDARSNNNAVRRAGGTVTAASTQVGEPGTGRGVPYPYGVLGNGRETSFDGAEEDEIGRNYFSTELLSAPGPASVTLSITYDRSVLANSLRFIEGDHFLTGPSGGWADAITLQVRSGGVWTDVVGSFSEAPDPQQPFQILDFTLPGPVTISGVRAVCTQGGTSRFVTCAELDTLVPAATPPLASFDLNDDGVLTVDDLYAWEAAPRDLLADGVPDAADRAYLTRAVRWGEAASFARPGL